MMSQSYVIRVRTDGNISSKRCSLHLNYQFRLSSKKFLQVTLLNLEEPPDLDTTDALRLIGCRSIQTIK